jgi:type II secretory pathway pseudopilin PulG
MLELLVVIAIISAIMTLAIMAMPKPGGRAAVSTAALNIESALKHAQLDAMRTDTTVSFQVIDNGQGYSVGNKAQYLRDGNSLKSLRQSNIDFGPDGENNGGHLILSGGSMAISISVEELTGRIDMRLMNSPRGQTDAAN